MKLEILKSFLVGRSPDLLIIYQQDYNLLVEDDRIWGIVFHNTSYKYSPKVNIIS